MLGTSMKSSPLVSVCIPTFQGELFLRETLASIISQTYTHLEIIISVDGNDLTTYAIKDIVADPRICFLLQEQHLGWVKNTNATLKQAKGAYVVIVPHDDLIDPQYIEILVEHLNLHPECVLAYTDLTLFYPDKTLLTPIIQPSLIGKPDERLSNFILNHFSAVGFRGLFRCEVLQKGGLSECQIDGYAADTLWMAQLACLGELHRLPYNFYTKRMHENNTHQKWFKWSETKMKEAWKIHCKSLFRFSEQSAKSEREKLQILLNSGIRYIFCFKLFFHRVAKLHFEESALKRFTSFLSECHREAYGCSMKKAPWRYFFSIRLITTTIFKMAKFKFLKITSK